MIKTAEQDLEIMELRTTLLQIGYFLLSLDLSDAPNEVGGDLDRWIMNIEQKLGVIFEPLED